MTETVKKTKSNLPGAGPGRPKGVPNKTTALLKDAILQAAEAAGGKDGLVGYLSAQAITSPASFLALLGKVLPLQVTGADGGAIEVRDEARSPREIAKMILALIQKANTEETTK